MELAEFIVHVREEVGGELIKTCCPMCFGVDIVISSNHACDWKPFYLNFKDKPEYLVAYLKEAASEGVISLI